ncbi:MAG TPA: ATP-binding protein [Solirubrobacteraceae bacterium]|jgi:anti-sigma regulatory factor (Ser/Thr protein kinase)|nr:ATP-binding protein [Solirubrobacteraceae bacterium]
MQGTSVQGASGSASSPTLADQVDVVAGQEPLYLSESRLAEAASVGWARRAVTELAAAAGMEGERLEDVRLAVSEAVTNSVAYAYEGAPGDVHVIAAVVSRELWVVVADDGMGMRRRPSEIRGLGLGLGLMARVSDALTILTRSSGGVEVQMRFHLDEQPS